MNIALIGVGGVGADHLQTIESLEKRKRLRLIAVADPHLAKLQAWYERLTSRGVRWYPGHRELLKMEDRLDAVVIATPIALHEEMLEDCLERGVFILLEKPPVPLLPQLDQVMKKERALRTAVAFQYICSREIRQLKQWIVEGRLGEIREIRIGAGWPRHDGYYQRAPWAGKMVHEGRPVFDGPATNGLAHLIHNAMFLAGSTFSSFAQPASVQAEFYRARPIESYDVACLRGNFASGAVFTAALAHAVKEYQPFCMEVRGTRDFARIGRDGALLETSKGRFQFENLEDKGPFSLLYNDFLRFIHGGIDAPATTLEETRGYLLATNLAYLSSGGIHDIPASHCCLYGSREGNGYDVSGLTGSIRRSLHEGALFSEMKIAWARAGSFVAIEDVQTHQMPAPFHNFWPVQTRDLPSGAAL